MGREALDAAAGIVATRAALAAAAIAVIVFLPAFLAAVLDQFPQDRDRHRIGRQEAIERRAGHGIGHDQIGRAHV